MKRQVIIINGGSTYDTYGEYMKHLKGAKFDFGRMTRIRWKDSFAKKLGAKFEVVQPRMPNSENARYAEWAIWFRKIVPFINNGVVLVGHSLGGIFLAKYLASQTLPKRIKATILIAAPFHDKGLKESLGDFTLPKSLRKFSTQGGRILIFHSTDDPSVPLQHAREYSAALKHAVLRIFQHKGHFNQSTFPELVSAIKSL